MKKAYRGKTIELAASAKFRAVWPYFNTIETIRSSQFSRPDENASQHRSRHCAVRNLLKRNLSLGKLIYCLGSLKELRSKAKM